MKLCSILTLSAGLLLVSFSLQASDYQSPRTAALGGAGSASPLLNDALYLNPSYTSFLPVYSASVSYLKFNGDPVKGASGEDLAHYGRTWNVSLQDGRSELFQAGLGYTVHEKGRFIHVGASRRALERLGFGLGAKFFLPQNESPLSFAKDLTFSTTGILDNWVQLSFVIDNLLQNDQGAQVKWDREFKVGSKFNIMKIILAYIDFHLIPAMSGGNQFGQEIGLEFAAFRDVFFRGGYFRNSKVAHESDYGRGVTFGAGWVGPRFSFDVAHVRALEFISGLPRSSAWTLGMTIYF